MALEAAVEGAAAELGDGVRHTAQHIIERQERLLARGHHDSLPAGVGTALFGALVTVSASLSWSRSGPFRKIGAKSDAKEVM